MSEDIASRILSNRALAAGWEAKADLIDNPEVARTLRECANDIKYAVHLVASESTPRLGEDTTTQRGFSLTAFVDRNGRECSLQTSSALDFSHCDPDDDKCMSRSMLWLGINDVKPVIMAQDAIALGIPTGGVSNGWVPYEVPSSVLMSSRMHMTIPMVKDLIHDLQRWVDIEDIE